MLKALFDADPSSDWILEGVETEAKRRISVKDVIEELSALLNFEVVGSVKSPLVNSASKVTFLRLSLSTAHQNVKGKDIMNCELLGVHSLVKGFLVDDHLISVNQMLLQLMGKHSLHSIHLV